MSEFQLSTQAEQSEPVQDRYRTITEMIEAADECIAYLDKKRVEDGQLTKGEELLYKVVQAFLNNLTDELAEALGIGDLVSAEK
jgi:hypothetical protein